jgi:hypothetical protein
VKDTPKGQQIRSRYYPVHSYAVCSNDRPWAWCLDKPCIVDKNNPEAASCTCDVVKNLGDYVIVTSNYTPNTCTTGVISSATVQQITQVTDYLKTKTKVLTPFNIQVLKKLHPSPAGCDAGACRLLDEASCGYEKFRSL